MSSLAPYSRTHEPMFLAQCGRPIFTPMQSKRQNYSSIYLDLYIFGQQGGKQKILYWIIARIPWLQCAPNFLHEKNFESLSMFPNIEVFHRFKGFMNHLYIDVVILHCMLVSRHDCVLSFLIIKSKPFSLLKKTEASVFSFTELLLTPCCVQVLPTGVPIKNVMQPDVRTAIYVRNIVINSFWQVSFMKVLTVWGPKNPPEGDKC